MRYEDRKIINKELMALSLGSPKFSNILENHAVTPEAFVVKFSKWGLRL